MNLTKLAKSFAYVSAAAMLGLTGVTMPISAQTSSRSENILKGVIRTDELSVDQNGKSIIGLVLGDSNSTEYLDDLNLWVNQINRGLARTSDYTIKNLSRGGAMFSNIQENSSYIDPFLGEYELAQLESIDYVPNLVIFLGTNDALMHVTQKWHRTNYLKFIDRVLSMVKTDRLILIAPSALKPLEITQSDGTRTEVVSVAASKISKQIKRYVTNMKKNPDFLSIIKYYGLKNNQVRVLNPDVFGVKEIWDNVHLDVESHFILTARVRNLMVLE